MIMTIKKEDLIKALNNVKPAAIANKEACPVNINVVNDEVQVYAHNAVYGISSVCSGVADKDFELVLNVQKLVNMLNVMQGGEVTFEKKGDKILIKDGYAVVTEIALTDSNKTVKELSDATTETTVQALDLIDMIEGCSHAMDKADGNNQKLAAIHFVLSQNGIKAEALDGKRISIRETQENVSGVDIILPSEVLSAVKRLDGEVVVRKSDDKVQFSDQNTTIVSTYITATYYDTKVFIMDNAPIKINVAKEDLMQATNLCLAQLSTEEMAKKVMTWYAKDGKLNVVANTTIGASVEMAIDAEITGTETFTIAVNAEYAKDALVNIAEDQITLECVNDRSPVIMAGSGYKEVIVPVKLN